MTATLGWPACLEQEPAALLRLVDEILQQAGSRHILVLVRELVGFAHVLDLSLVVVHEFVEHIDGPHIVLVVVFDALQLRDLSNRADRGAADLAGALGEDVDTAFQLLGLLVEQEMIVAEMWSADMPMEVLGLDVDANVSASSALSAADTSRTASDERSVGVSSRAGAVRGSSFLTLVVTGLPRAWGINYLVLGG